MADLIRMFSQLDAATQLAILLPLATVIAGGATWVFRKIGLARAPGVATNLVAVLVGAALGYVGSQSWQGAVIGALTGLAATGGNQMSRQTQKLTEDGIDAAEADLPRLA